ncbi:raffinose/stachyose/melibiose transport system substrate-binding protein [Cryobacterium mesophilum]|uniref:Probable sugar-binding periplasmic protein n=1 Tax=Terrimesophilobacter mesophilus TaxID=433647 RepID=A0A4R8VCY7_9MICO|nr:ABC transporter substrate-binding protein [Terrimesophilobacter mesophilus]MBB5633256.1 raffinose/stachyose/melibiose transport system substrate-binding protein [Terrimesophilobacter mesophilus]TFB80000.1 carbohydrate ABC transporter substrate-binding protein [Terrimesophilobacter mesophilus]
MKSRIAPLALALATAMIALAGCSGAGSGDQVTLQFESWRPEDAAIWNSKIIPAFEKEHPDIKVQFSPTKATEYDAALKTRFQGGTAGDLITCRSGALNRENIKAGYLEPLKGLAGLSNFDELSQSFWASSEGDPYCVPVASVMAAFFYNKDIFKELNLQVPTTQAEFMSVLQAIKSNGKYVPLALGATPGDAWVLAFMGLYNEGPNYWHGEDGRQGLIDGTKKFTDPEFVEALDSLKSWTPYMPDGRASVTYSDATQLFALGKAAIFPSGSWDITAVTGTSGIDVGVFAPPLPQAGDQLYIQSHPDMGIGINAASKHKKQAQVFLDWVATSEFQTLYANALPGFFGMGKDAVKLDNPLAQAWSDLKTGAQLTPRLGQDILSGGNPDFEVTMENSLQLMMTTDKTAAEVADETQKGLEAWYPPQMK